MSDKREFSTAHLPRPDRMAAWNEFMSETFFNLELNTKGADNEVCLLRTNTIENIGTTHYAVTEQEMITRRATTAATDGVETFVFVFPLAGKFESQQRSHLVTARPGEVYCLNSTEGYSNFVSEKPQSLVVTAPLPLLRERMGWIDDCTGRGDAANADVVPLVQNFCLTLTNLRTSPGATDAKLQAACLDLLTLMMESNRKGLRGDLVPWSMKETLRTNLQLFIKQNFAKPGLTALDAAGKFGVSERYIQKLMSEQGTTFQQAVIDCRLDEARRLLANPTSDLQIGQIAFLCGFVNQAHFATRYRKRFGNTPRDERMAVITPYS